MITKEIFVDTIDFMRTRSEQMTKLSRIFGEEFEDSCFYPYFKWEAQMCKVLKTVMQDSADWIDYYCWELDFGSKWEQGTVTQKDGTDIPLKTAEDLWNLLQEQSL